MYKNNSINRIWKQIKNIIKFFIRLFQYRGLKYGKIISIKDIQAGNFSNVELLSCDNVRLYYSHPVFNDGSANQSELNEGMEYIQYAVSIKNGIVYGDSNQVTLTRNKVLFDMPFYDVSNRFLYYRHYTTSKILSVKGENIYYWKGKTLKMEKAIWMGGYFSWNYWHLTYEYINKFLYLNKLDIPLDFHVLVDQVCLDFPQYKELIDMANYKGYPVAGINRQYRVKIGELIFINCPHYLPPNLKKNDHLSEDLQFNVNALRDLRNYLLPYSSCREFPKRIFMSRKNASNRKRFNEDAVVQLLSKFGFEVLDPGTLSVADQISLFNQAEWVMGGTGAAFTNLLYCNETTKVILFSRARYLYTPFSTIASALGISLLNLTEEDTNKNIVRGGIHDSFEIDIPYLEKTLIELGLANNKEYNDPIS